MAGVGVWPIMRSSISSLELDSACIGSMGSAIEACTRVWQVMRSSVTSSELDFSNVSCFISLLGFAAKADVGV